MNFAKWETEENMKKYIPLIGVNWNTEVKSSGLPMLSKVIKSFIFNHLSFFLIFSFYTFFSFIVHNEKKD